MRILKYAAVIGMVIGMAGMMPRAASAQVRVGIGIGIGTPVYAGPPPACTYGYYPYAPYACAPYGYYGSEWFVNGVFIGAGPWFRGFYGPAFSGRRSLAFDDPAWIYFHDRGGWRDFRNGDHWRDYRGGSARVDRGHSGWAGFLNFGALFGQDRRGNRGRTFQGRDFQRNNGFRGGNRGGNRFRGFRGSRDFRGRVNPSRNRGFNGRRSFRGNGPGRGHADRGHGRGH